MMLNGQTNFKSRVKTVLIQCASIYNSFFVCQDHLIFRMHFTKDHTTYSHTAGRIYAIVKDGMLKHLAYYDENHKQAVSIDFAHEHKGVKPHRHVYMSHDNNSPGVPPTTAELILIDKIRREFHLK